MKVLNFSIDNDSCIHKDIYTGNVIKRDTISFKYTQDVLLYNQSLNSNYL
jgi:hypothetical protein